MDGGEGAIAEGAGEDVYYVDGAIPGVAEDGKATGESTYYVYEVPEETGEKLQELGKEIETGREHIDAELKEQFPDDMLLKGYGSELLEKTKAEMMDKLVNPYEKERMDILSEPSIRDTYSKFEEATGKYETNSLIEKSELSATLENIAVTPEKATLSVKDFGEIVSGSNQSKSKETLF